MLSNHAKLRCAQRGVSPGLLEAILTHADIDRPAGGNCRLTMVSRRHAAQLNLGDRLSRFAVILSETTSQIVTVMPLHRHKRVAGWQP